MFRKCSGEEEIVKEQVDFKKIKSIVNRKYKGGWETRERRNVRKGKNSRNRISKDWSFHEHFNSVLSMQILD